MLKVSILYQDCMLKLIMCEFICANSSNCRNKKSVKDRRNNFIGNCTSAYIVERLKFVLVYCSFFFRFTWIFKQILLLQVLYRYLLVYRRSTRYIYFRGLLKTNKKKKRTIPISHTKCKHIYLFCFFFSFVLISYIRTRDYR